jgi:hypothetical protein
MFAAPLLTSQVATAHVLMTTMFLPALRSISKPAAKEQVEKH